MFLLTITQLEHGNKIRENNYFMQMFFPPCCTFMLILTRKIEKLLCQTRCANAIVSTSTTRGPSCCVFWDWKSFCILTEAPLDNQMQSAA